MSEYARRNLVCSSWIKLPEGWHAWTGMSGGYSERPFCTSSVGHPGDHEVWAEHQTETQPVEVNVTDGISGSPTYGQSHVETMDRPITKRFTWPNKGIPLWFAESIQRGLEVLAERRPELREQARVLSLALSEETDRKKDVRGTLERIAEMGVR